MQTCLFVAGEGFIDSGPDRHEQLKLLGNKQPLLQAGSSHSIAADTLVPMPVFEDDADLEAIE